MGLVVPLVAKVEKSPSQYKWGDNRFRDFVVVRPIVSRVDVQTAANI